MKVLCVVGARPNFMKIAPILRALDAHAAKPESLLVHTGQHYDEAMNDRFFAQLGIRAPDVSLEVGSATHAVQTAEVMKRFEPVLDESRPDVVLVVGDVNSTLACALVAAKKGVPVVHVEAGLRSRDRAMPEEINRILTDQLSDRLYTTEASALDNLVGEGIDAGRVVFAGNVMIDTLLHAREAAVPVADTLAQNRVPADVAKRFALVTLHRPSNVDDGDVLRGLLTSLREAAGRIPVVFPMHPRTRARIEAEGLGAQMEAPGLYVLPPLGYHEMLGLTADATVVLTDSGGLQEETTALGVPCLTLRDNTERPITLSEGTNTLVGSEPAAIRAALDQVLSHRVASRARIPEGWDGRAAERIVDHLLRWLATDRARAAT